MNARHGYAAAVLLILVLAPLPAMGQDDFTSKAWLPTPKNIAANPDDAYILAQFAPALYPKLGAPFRLSIRRTHGKKKAYDTGVVWVAGGWDPPSPSFYRVGKKHGKVFTRVPMRRVKPGSYSLSRIMFRYEEGYPYIESMKDDLPEGDFEFEVAPGDVVYLGSFLYSRVGGRFFSRSMSNTLPELLDVLNLGHEGLGLGDAIRHRVVMAPYLGPAPALWRPGEVPGAATPQTTSTATGDKPWERPGTRAGEEIVGPGGIPLVWVPDGSFTMGSTDADLDHAVQQLDAKRGWFECEQPAHRVELVASGSGRPR